MDAEQFRRNVEHQNRCSVKDGIEEPEGVIVVDVTTWQIKGVGVTLTDAIERARDDDDACPFCDCGRDDSNLYAYRLHPYALDMLDEGYGDQTIKEERLRWEGDEGRFRWAGFAHCLLCDGDGCDSCGGDGVIEGDEDGAGWWAPPPEPPRGSIWQGTRSRCLDLAEQREKEREARHAATMEAIRGGIPYMIRKEAERRAIRERDK